MINCRSSGLRVRNGALYEAGKPFGLQCAIRPSGCWRDPNFSQKLPEQWSILVAVPWHSRAASPPAIGAGVVEYEGELWMSGLSVDFVATGTVSLLVLPFVQNEGIYPEGRVTLAILAYSSGVDARAAKTPNNIVVIYSRETRHVTTVVVYVVLLE